MKKLIVYIITVVIIVIIVIPPTIKIINNKIYHLRLKHKQAAKKLADENLLMQNLRALTEPKGKEAAGITNLYNIKGIHIQKIEINLPQLK